MTTRLNRLRRSARQPKSVRDSRRTGQVSTSERREDRGEDREERPGQGEPGPGPDVGQGRARGQDDQENRQEQQTRKLAHLTQFFGVPVASQ